MNKETHALLNSVYQNAKMGIDSLTPLKEKVKDQELLKLIGIQLNEYKKFEHESEKMLREYGINPNDKGFIAKGILWISIQLKTVTNKDKSNVADMMINGNSMGIVELVKELKKEAKASPRSNFSS